MLYVIFRSVERKMTYLQVARSLRYWRRRYIRARRRVGVGRADAEHDGCVGRDPVAGRGQGAQYDVWADRVVDIGDAVAGLVIDIDVGNAKRGQLLFGLIFAELTQIGHAH